MVHYSINTLINPEEIEVGDAGPIDDKSVTLFVLAN